MVAATRESQLGSNFDTLSELGFSLREADRLNQLSPKEKVDVITQQVNSLTMEVLADDPVSPIFSYWMDEENELYTHSSKKEVFKIKNGQNEFFDPRERGNLPWYGFQKAKNLLSENNSSVVMLYSPIGKTYFGHDYHTPSINTGLVDGENTYKKIGRYPDGQLYVYYRNGKRIDGIALKTSHNDVMQNFMPDVHSFADTAETENDFIASYILNPVATPFTLDEFFDQNWGDRCMYRDHNGKEHTIQEVMGSAREVVAGKQRVVVPLNQKTVQELQKAEVTSDTILKAYLNVVADWAESHGIKDLIELKGSCGGKKVKMSTISALLEDGAEFLNDIVSPMSSFRRLFDQGNLQNILDSDTSNVVKFKGDKKVNCVCGEKVTITRKEFFGGSIKCNSCGAHLDSQCDVQGVYAGDEAA